MTLRLISVSLLTNGRCNPSNLSMNVIGILMTFVCVYRSLSNIIQSFSSSILEARFAEYSTLG